MINNENKPKCFIVSIEFEKKSLNVNPGTVNFVIISLHIFDNFFAFYKLFSPPIKYRKMFKATQHTPLAFPITFQFKLHAFF